MMLQLFWHVGRSHMSPTFFPNPKSFNPSRFEGQGPQPFTYVPFGGGPHMCPGIDFARTQMVVFLHYLVLNYEWTMVDPNEKIAMDPQHVHQMYYIGRLEKFECQPQSMYIVVMQTCIGC